MCSDSIRDASGLYRLESASLVTARLRFDRGTLLLEDCPSLPPSLSNWFRYDPRVDAWRAPAHGYGQVIGLLRGLLARNQAPRYGRLELNPALPLEPYPHQNAALDAWWAARGRGVIVLPTGAGKTLVGVLALARAARDTMITVPTIDLLHQWYALLRLAFPDREIGLVGGGYHEPATLTVATYDSAARHMERLGNRYGLIVFDEVHHLPSEFYRVIAEFALAPYRLGLSATPERGDGRHLDLVDLVGPTVYRKHPEELAGTVLAPFEIRPRFVELSQQEREEYRQAMAERNDFLRANHIRLGSLTGWNRFVMKSAQSPEGRRAMQAHRRARGIAHATTAKLRALATILSDHRGEKTIIFTEDNATAYTISRRFLVPCLTHQTRVKERQAILEGFRDGLYTVLASSNVLNEGVDVPDASIAVILSGSGSSREFVQRLGRVLRRGATGKRAVLYEVVARETREERVSERRRERMAPEPPSTGDLFGDN